MDETTSKEKLLKKMRHALLYQTPNPVKELDRDSHIYRDVKEELDVNFAQEFMAAGGVFLYCENENETKNALKSLYEEYKWTNVYCEDVELQYLLNKAGLPYKYDSPATEKKREVGITACEFIVSRLGSILLSSQNGMRNAVFPDTHVVIAYSHQLRYDLEDALQAVQLKYGKHLPSALTFITGTCRTFAIEQREVKAGAGANKLFLILTDTPEP